MPPQTCCLLLLTLIASSFAARASRDVILDSSSMNSGDVHFRGQVVNAACVVSAGSQYQTVLMRQVRSAQFQGVGDWSPAVDFQIRLEDCETTVSQQAGVMFTGTTDGKDPQIFQVGNGASAAQGVGIGIFDAAGNLVIPNTSPSWLTPLQDGKTILNYSAKYRATDQQVFAGNANAEVWFNVVYQ